ncbi:MAG TPA: 3'(2'),5'-bisphosphate nucleotidase CysQ [Bacteroidales bacterium]|nr:MAG: 3'(2'),5'-bisphosphate nucleotidase CysQ [Bacteroidetes bacterium ADurb.Bin217]HPH15878.1 3'(2'),5'-bisphosphate nucleotidase CysQ [Bacteroidales bacterium]HPM12185.1 3'(2'),5'-bisphosphate nucleotidase CysQ [Bacteroidales bacterium]
MHTLFSTAIEAALCAGVEIMRIYESEDIKISTKEDSSPVTQADIAASTCIEHKLAQTHIPILCEETTHAPFSIRKTWKMLWIVDPLDGTKDFIEKNGEFTVNIALVSEGTPLFGVIYIPVYDTLYFGGPNHGAYMLSQCSLRLESFDYNRIKQISTVLPVVVPCNSTIIVASRSFYDKDTEEFIQSMLNKHTEYSIKHIGSSLKFLEVASGKAHMYPRKSHIHEWDIAAGHAITQGAGCSVTTIDTLSPIAFNTDSLLCPGFIVKR